MIEVGKSYYFIQHAYHHFIGTVEAIEGPRRYRLVNVVKVHSDGRDWTIFFKQGISSSTKYDIMPDGLVCDHPMNEIPWQHEIPRTK